MWTSIKWFWLMCLATFTNKDLINNNENISGFSWRKIAGLAGLITAIDITILHITEATYLSTLYSWQIFVSVCIGLITIPELLKTITTIKNDNTNQ